MPGVVVDVMQRIFSMPGNYPVKEFIDNGYFGMNFSRLVVRKLLREVKENKVACMGVAL